MAIVHMAHKREEIPADAVNVRDASDSWRPQPDSPEALAKMEEIQRRFAWTPERCAAFQLFTYETHIGLCLEDRERNGHGDGNGGYIYSGVNIHLAAKDGAHIEAAVLPEKVYRVAATAEQKQAALVKALDYQDTLTKTGTVRQRKVKDSPAVAP